VVEVDDLANRQENLVLDMTSGVLISITTLEQELTVSAKSFETVQGMSDYQAARELQEALRVQGMSPEARWIWLQQTWGRLQDSAAFLRPDDQPMPGAARSYATLNEKNRFDEDREIRQALKMSMRMAHQS
jgi:hypothetical protein